MKKFTKKITLLALSILCICLIYAAAIFFLVSPMEARGQFGDMFGALNAIFSGGALVGVVIAIILQRRELELQRKELKLTREELKKSAQAQLKSERALTRQAESLRATAKLNGLSALLRHIGTMSQQGAGFTMSQAMANNANRITADIKSIIDRK